MTHPSPARADARANRDKLVAAAREVFAERGLEADIREICARSGLGMGTLYRNFPTKDELVVAVLRDIAAEVTLAIAAAEAADDARDGFVQMLRGMWTVVEDHRQLAGILHGYAHERDLPEFEALKARAERIIERAIAAGHLQAGLSAALVADCVERQIDTYLALRERWDAGTVRALCERMLGGLMRADA